MFFVFLEGTGEIHRVISHESLSLWVAMTNVFCFEPPPPLSHPPTLFNGFVGWMAIEDIMKLTRKLFWKEETGGKGVCGGGAQFPLYSQKKKTMSTSAFADIREEKVNLLLLEGLSTFA